MVTLELHYFAMPCIQHRVLGVGEGFPVSSLPFLSRRKTAVVALLLRIIAVFRKLSLYAVNFSITSERDVSPCRQYNDTLLLALFET